jgi:hypothetical protein
MERKEYPNGVSIELDVNNDTRQLVARVYDDKILKKTFESKDAHDAAGTYAKVLVRVKGHRDLRR